MISKIIINNVASYTHETCLSTGKKVNIIYGLNGTGKSTFSNYLADYNNPSYSGCNIEGLDLTDEILVYNQKFIDDNFYASDDLKGIFTLSKRNTRAEKNVSTIIISKKELQNDAIKKNLELEKFKSEKEKLLNDIKNDIWEIKKKFSGGDGILEYCFLSHKRKDNLYEYFLSLPEPKEEPNITIAGLKKEIESLNNDKSQALHEYELIPFNDETIISDNLWRKVIVGNKDSTLSEVINKLENSDWVKVGLKYIDTNLEDEQICPFCQKKTVNIDFLKNLKLLFDKSYEEDIEKLKTMKIQYLKLFESVKNFEKEPDCELYSIQITKLKQKYHNYLLKYEKNIQNINQKINQPSLVVPIVSLSPDILEMNNIILSINTIIKSFNDKIKNKQKILDLLRDNFWLLMRWRYSSSIRNFNKSKKDIELKLKKINDENNKIISEIDELNCLLIKEQGKTININGAVDNIKAELLDLGIDGFTIENHEGNFYRLVRPGMTDKTFITLSEGEKMIISFLYFIEMCQGRINIEKNIKKKIIIIDDPISSLSHIYIFNISQLIKKYFTNKTSNCDQVFIMTHSLYFFYDLTFINKVDRDKYQNLYRIIKNEKGSSIVPMKYTEIENDYQSYWSVVKDSQQSPALIANCMRNIIEYFFAFVEKTELCNVFQKAPLKENRFQAFYRYINRESHSVGQNIFDLKEFNYVDFKEGFKFVFYETGYKKHYDRMIK